MMTIRACINSAVAAITCLVGFSMPAQADPRGDELLAELARAPAESAAFLEGKLIAHWSQSGSPMLDLLLERGQDAITAGDSATAIGHLTALIDHAPDFAQGYVARAESYLMANLPGPAVADLRQALHLEPRHIQALAGLSLLLSEIGSTAQAREVLAELLRLSPHSQDGALLQQMLDDIAGAKDA